MAPLPIDTSKLLEVPLEHCIDLHLFERQLKGKQVFTRAVIEDAAQLIEKIRENPRTKDSVFRQNVHGKKVQIWPLQKAKYKPSHGVHLEWNKFCNMAEDHLPPFRLYTPSRPCKQSDYLALNHIKAEADKSNPEFQSSEPDIALLTRWTLEWETHPYSPALENKLSKFKNQPPITNIVCFGLGPIYHAPTPHNPQDLSPKLTSPTIQHMLASKIANHLQTLYAQHNNPHTQPIPMPMPITAHDPAYSPQDIGLLAHLHPPIHAVSNPEHFLAITPHTLILSIFPPSHAGHWELIADLTHPHGPAAMLCNHVKMQARNLQGICHAVVDVCTPRVVAMFGRYEETELGSVVSGVTEEEVSDVDAACVFLKYLKLYTREEPRV